MAVVQKGIGVAWGITDTGYSFTGTATYYVKGTEQGVKKDAKLEEHADPSTGSTVGLTFYDPTKEVTLRVWPYGNGSPSTLANAITNAAVLPSVGDKFTITNAGDAVAAGDYVVMSVGRTRKVGGKVEFDITLKQWDSDLTATIS